MTATAIYDLAALPGPKRVAENKRKWVKEEILTSARMGREYKHERSGQT